VIDEGFCILSSAFCHDKWENLETPDIRRCYRRILSYSVCGNIRFESGSFSWNYFPETVVAGEQTGTATILAGASSVSVTSRVISATNCGTSCGGGNNLTGSPPAVNVNTEYWFSAAVGDTGGLVDIDNIVIYIYKTGITKTTFDEQRAYGFRWVRKNWSGRATIACDVSTGCWHELNGVSSWSETLTYLVSAQA